MISTVVSWAGRSTYCTEKGVIHQERLKEFAVHRQKYCIPKVLCNRETHTLLADWSITEEVIQVSGLFLIEFCLWVSFLPQDLSPAVWV